MKNAFRLIWVVLFLLPMLSVQVFAENGQYNLAPPPAKDSITDQRDFKILHQYQDQRTEEQCDVADRQTLPTVKNLFGPQTGVLTAGEFAKVAVLGDRWLVKTMSVASVFKNRYRRERPYNVDSTLHPCIRLPGGDKSYPSSHAAAGIVLAEVFAAKFPEKREVILKQGKQIGVNRLIGGVHHPSDVIAGRELARQILVNEGFRGRR